jgi:ParB-like chromosome segregation protein Spo0J/DNA modification methylase
MAAPIETTKGASKIERIAVEMLLPYAKNSRTHSDEQVAQIAASIKEFGFNNPILIDKENTIIAGHGRLLAARRAGMDDVPCIRLEHLTDTQRKAYIIADNRLALNAGWDNEVLSLELSELLEDDFDLDLLGFEADELDALLGNEEEGEEPEKGKGNLSDRFLVPPFSVLNAREGWWQDRKRAWLALGIKSEEGRDIAPTSVSKNTPEYMQGRGNNEGGSIFDPVLCELAYAWFSPPGGIVLDPFAGGSVRGIVASKLGRQYIGHELRQEQVAANQQQGSEICGEDAAPPAWICGDSRNIDQTCADVKADLVFSCPPYADLEVYSDDPKDLSTLGYEQFRGAYFEIIKKACALLKPDRFACFVVGEVRDKKGNYYDFVGDTIKAFRAAGLEYYNEAILVTAVGSLPIRAGKQFSASRKLGKTHQNVLVFVKGDGKRAAKACGDVQIDLSAMESEGVADA